MCVDHLRTAAVMVQVRPRYGFRFCIRLGEDRSAGHVDRLTSAFTDTKTGRRVIKRSCEPPLFSDAAEQKILVFLG